MNDMTPVSEVITDKTETVADTPAPQPEFEAEKVFQLSRKISAPDGTIIESVTLRAPNGFDVFYVKGNVTRTLWSNGKSGREMTIEQDTEKFQAWLLRLSNQPLAVLGQIPARDLKFMYDWLSDELSAVGN